MYYYSAIGIMAALLLTANAAEKKQLKFTAEGTFKIVQFTDIHFGEDWKDDEHVNDYMLQILQAEQPDFIAVTGDMVSGYAWDGVTKPWYEKVYANFTKALVQYGQVWATVGGNHDQEADLTREQVSEVDRSYDLSLTKPNAAQISHVFNYWLPVYDSTGTNIIYRLWFLDTGREDCLNNGGWDCVRPDQVEWFRQENTKITKEDPSKGKGMMFIHIPMPEYTNLFNDFPFYGTKEENAACFSVNTGLFAAIKEQPSVDWVTCGHDHNNDYYGVYQGINLAYGRKSGYGSYGPKTMPVGARVFSITLKDQQYSVDTWVRTENGTEHRETEYRKRSLFDFPQPSCGGGVADKEELMEYLLKYSFPRNEEL